MSSSGQDVQSNHSHATHALKWAVLLSEQTMANALNAWSIQSNWSPEACFNDAGELGVWCMQSTVREDLSAESEHAFVAHLRF